MADRDLTFNLIARDEASDQLAAVGEAAADMARRVEGADATVEVKADADRADKELEETEDQAADLDEQEVEVEVDADTSRAEKAMAALGAAAVAAAAAMAAAIGGALEQSDVTGRLQAQLGVAADTAGRYGEIAGEVYGQGFGESLADTGETVRMVYQQIGDVGAVEGGLEGVTARVSALTDVFDQDLRETVAAVGSMMRTGLVRDAGEALDLITVGMQGAANKGDDLLDTMSEYSVQFQALGVDGATAMGLINQALSAGAYNADFVQDALKEFNIRAIEGAGATAAAFKALGLSGKRMSSDIAGGGPKAAAALDATLDRLRAVKDPAKRSALAVALFGTKSEDLQRALYAMDPSTAVAGLGEVGGAAQRAADAVSGTAAAKLEQGKRALMAGLAEVGAGMVSWAQQHEGWIRGVGSGLAAAWGGAKAVMSGVVAVLSNPVFQTLAVAVLAMTAAWKAYTIAIMVPVAVTKAWAAAQVALNIVMSANPIGVVVLAIVGLAAAVVFAWKRFEGFRNVVTGVWNAVRSVISSVVSWVTATIPRMTAAASAAWSRIQAGASAAWGAVSSRVSAAVSAVVGFVTGLPGRVLGVFSRAGSMLTGAGSAMVAGFRSGISAAWDRLVGWIREQINRIPLAVRQVLGIASPSRVFAEIGEQTGAGLVVGMESSMGAVSAAAQALVAVPSAEMASGWSGPLVPSPRSGIGPGGGQPVQPVVVHVHIDRPLGSPREIATAVQDALSSAAAGSLSLEPMRRALRIS